MRRILVVGAVLGLAAIAASLGAWALGAQRADYGWRPVVGRPTHADAHPRVVVDEAHHNASTVGMGGRFWPFARLLRADGYRVERGRRAFEPATLAGIDVLVVANASGGRRPQLFGINLPGGSAAGRDAPAFTAAEVAAVRAWVEDGGALLLVADHAPFGAAAADLSRALGVVMHGGFVEVPGERSDPLVFSRANGRLGDHPLLAASPAIARVESFTGQSLDGPPGAAALLRLPDHAIEQVPVAGDSLAERRAGAAQAIAFELGRGRVVVLGEAGMITAQVSRGERFGMNAPGNDNARFVLALLRWLSRAA